MAVRWMGIPIGAETRFAEALKTGQYQRLPRLRELRAEAQEMAAEEQAKATTSGKEKKGGKAAERTLAAPKGPAPQSKNAQQQQRAQPK